MASYINPDSGTLIINSTNDVNLESPVSSTSALSVLGGQYIAGNLYVGGTLVANGDIITIGNSGGSLTFNSNISSDVIPSDTIYSLGSNTKHWDKIFVNKILYTPTPDLITAQIDVEKGVSYITLSSQTSLSLVDGTQVGQINTIICTDTITVPVTVIPDNPLGYTSFQFINQGDSVTLMWTSEGWSITSHYRTNISI